MKLVIAEKPSVAAEIAHCLGAYEKIYGKNGMACYTGNGYYVTNALGHLYDIGQPPDYGYSNKWALNELPMLPSEFKIIPKSSSDSSFNKMLTGQRDLISELINHPDVDEVVCATDAGREGELIFRYIYNANNCQKPVKRLWISSMTEESITNGFKNLKPGSDYDNMYAAGFARAKADWLIGMNLSRLYSVLDNCNHKVGRVKTPVLNIVVRRDISVKNFVKTPFYKVYLDNGAECEIEFSTRQEAEKVQNICAGKTANVISAETTEKKENRPLLHNLTSLQQEANDVYGMTAADTLKAAQSLYEKKLLTYPRTDSNYLPDDMKPVIEATVKALSETSEKERAEQLIADGLNIDSRVIDNSKISDHHALIVTTQIGMMEAVKLDETEHNILNLVINRFLSVLDKPYRYRETKYKFWCEDYEFSLTAKVPIELGWRKYSFSDEPKEFPSGELNYRVNDSFIVNSVTVKDCEKQPPKHYTDSSLLSVMENIDNMIEDKILKGYVSGKGLGTPATRAAIIEELIAGEYLLRKGKNIVATDFGIEFIQSIPESVKSVERTAEWEQIFEAIGKGECGEDKLLDDIKQFIKLTVLSESQAERKMQNTNAVQKVSLGKCPRCGKDILEGKQNYYCECGQKCGFTIWKINNFYVGEITADNVRQLLSGDGKTSLRAKNKEGKVYTAEYQLDDTGQYVNFKRLAEEKISLGKCPRCGKDIYEGKNNFYCEGGQSCNFTIWKHTKRPEVTVSVKNVRELLSTGKTTISAKQLNGTAVKKTYRLEDTQKYINLVQCDE